MTGASASPASRAAALGLLALALGVVYLVAVEPLVARLRTYDESIAELGHRLGQYARIASARTQLEGQIAALDAQLPLDEDLLVGGTAALAGADLQERVKTIVLRHGGDPISAHPTEPQAEGDLQRIGVEITLDTDIAALKAMLHAIESGRPVLFVDHLQVRAKDLAAADGLLGEFDPVGLTVDLEIHGYRRPEAP